VDFPSSAAISTIRQLLKDMKLQHTIENGETKNIRITSDVPIPVRYKSQVLGELWQKVTSHPANLPQARPVPIPLSDSNGKFYLVRRSRPIERFETSIGTNGNMHVTAKAAHLASYKITTELSDAWIADAVAAASRFAPKKRFLPRPCCLAAGG
jgi:hypothetical protein